MATNFFPYSGTVKVALSDESGNATLARGTVANLPTGAGYAIGCEYQATDTGALYVNMGTATAASFSIAGSVSSAIQNLNAQVSLSSAQILALNATPVTLVAAPGAGKVIVVRGITFKMVTTATAYANGGALEFRYTNASGAKVTADIAAAVVTAGAGTSYTSVAGVTTSLTNVANAAIVVDNATAAFDTGTGTAQVSIVYDVITA
jgi:hypothetical protein